MLAVAQTTGLDIATAIVAGYAAVVASVALAFQVISSLRTWQTRVEVNLRPNMNVVSVGQAPPHQAVVVIELINHSGHRVKIVGQGFLPQRRGGGLEPSFPGPGAFPRAGSLRSQLATA